MQALLNRFTFPGSETVQSFIGRRILGSFSLIRTAILVTGIANVLLFQYLDSAEVQERNKTVEQGKLDHLSFVLQTQIQAYESAVWDTGKLPGTVTAARDLYTGEATADLLALRKLDPTLLAPGGALHGFVLGYLQLNAFWRAAAPVIAAGGDLQPLQTQWQGQQTLLSSAPQALDSYRSQVAQDQQRLQRAKADAKQGAIILSGIIGFISFALSIALAVVLTRQIVPPVIRLRDALQQVALGDLSPRASVRGKDEISQLLTTFNASVARLRDLLLAVRDQAHAISAESGRLKLAFAGQALAGPDVAGLETALDAAGRLAAATAEVTALTAPVARWPGPGVPAPAAPLALPAAANGAGAAEPPAAAPLTLGPVVDGVGVTEVLSAERARVLEELTRGVVGISARLGEVTSRADRLLIGVQAADARPAPGGLDPLALARELGALNGDARAAAAQLEALIEEVRNTQEMTATSVGNLDRAAGYLHDAVAQFRLQS